MEEAKMSTQEELPKFYYKEGPDGRLYLDPEREEPNHYQINKYGMMWIEWLEENHRLEYQKMRCHRYQMKKKMEQVSELAQDMFREITTSLAAKNGTEQISDFMKKLHQLNQEKAIAEEIVLREVVFQMH